MGNTNTTTQRRAKRDFKVIRGSEYKAFNKIRLQAVRSVDEMRAKVRNMDMSIELLCDSRRELGRQLEKLQNALGVSEFFPKPKKGGK